MKPYMYLLFEDRNIESCKYIDCVCTHTVRSISTARLAFAIIFSEIGNTTYIEFSKMGQNPILPKFKAYNFTKYVTKSIKKALIINWPQLLGTIWSHKSFENQKKFLICWKISHHWVHCASFRVNHS